MDLHITIVLPVAAKEDRGHYKNFKDKMPEQFQKIMEQEHHIKICVSAYRYITKGNDPKDKNPIPEEERIPIHVQEKMLQELDDAYRDYFYDRAEKPKLYIHPAGSAAAEYMNIHQYSFMKKNSKPYPIRDLHYDVESDMQMDLFDIGGCGCFVQYA